MEDRFDFIGKTKIFIGISLCLFAAIAVGIFTRGVDLDIQFKGGMIVSYAYDGALDLTELGQKVGEWVGNSVSVQQSDEIATGRTALTISMAGGLESQEMTELDEMLLSTYAEHHLETLSISNVNPVIGGEFLAKSLTAVALASALMMLYVALRFRRIGGLSAGVMAVVALIHDILIVFGVFVLFGFSINDNFIAVVLTILGYSLNDTIVIYDRVRENSGLMDRRTPVAELVNHSINQSFTRTLFTSITTIMAMVVVTAVAYRYNVTSILSFALPMVFGLVAGTYSSICIAGPLWVKWQESRGQQVA